MGQDVARPKSPAIWRWGFIFGGSAGALGIAAAVATLALTAGLSLLLDAVFVLLVLALYFGSGLVVARQTGSVSAATLSGVVAGIFSAILREIAAVFITYNKPLPAVTTTGLDVGSLRTVIVVISVLFVLMIFGGLGAGLAALGGLAGRPRSAMPYPVMYAGTPGFPPQGYPMPSGYGPPPGYPMPQGYGPPPGYPVPQGYAPPPGYPVPQGFDPSGYAPSAYPPAGWYPPAPAMPSYPPPLPNGASSGSRTFPPTIEPSPTGSVEQTAQSNPADALGEAVPPSLLAAEQPVYPPPPPPAHPRE